MTTLVRDSDRCDNDRERRPQLVLLGSQVERAWGIARANLQAACIAEQGAQTAMAYGSSAGAFLRARQAWVQALALEQRAYRDWTVAADLEPRVTDPPDAANLPATHRPEDDA